MEQLIELLKQIQELAGVGVDALKEASGGGKGKGEGGPPREGPPGDGPPGDGPPPGGGGRPPGGKPPMEEGAPPRPGS